MKRSVSSASPWSLGYRMPAEWEPHAASWIAWPHNRDDWPGKFAPIPWVYTEIVRHLSRVELVQMPPQSVDVGRTVCDQVFPVVNEQPEFARGTVELSHREIRLTQRRAGHGKGVDGIGLAVGAGGVASAGAGGGDGALRAGWELPA